MYRYLVAFFVPVLMMIDVVCNVVMIHFRMVHAGEIQFERHKSVPLDREETAIVNVAGIIGTLLQSSFVSPIDFLLH